MRHQLVFRFVMLLSFVLIGLTVLAQQANTPPKQPTTIQRPQPAQPKTPTKTADGKAEKAPAVPTISREEKEQILKSTVANVAGTAFQVEPVEYSILVQVEVAALLWDKEREAASVELTNACSRLREIMVERKDAAPLTKMSSSEKRRLRMSILRKIAKLNPDLIRDLMVDPATEKDKSRPEIVPEATEEGAAIMAIAVEEIERDPQLAIQLAEQSLSHGVTGAIHIFLTHLSMRDRQLAETQAEVFLTKLRQSSLSPIVMVNIRNFLSPARMEYYLESLAIRLRRDLRPGLSRKEYSELVTASKIGVQHSATYQAWAGEFVRLVAEFEALMAAQSIPPAQATNKTISMSGATAATPENTAEIKSTAEKLDAVANQRIKDAEFQKLAVEAAEKADDVLAERLLAKISDEQLRRQTSIRVYGPLIRKALSEKDWPQARNYALSVTDPMGLSLMADTVAKAMLSAKQDKQIVKSFYQSVLSNLDREAPSFYVSKGIIAIAKSRLADDAEGGFAAANLAVSVLNKADVSQPFSNRFDLAKSLSPWVTQTNYMLGVDDYFDVTETLAPLFRDLCKRDIQRTQSLASALTHQGLRSLAQLGFAKGIQEDLQKAKSSAGKQKSPTNEK